MYARIRTDSHNDDDAERSFHNSAIDASNSAIGRRVGSALELAVAAVDEGDYPFRVTPRDPRVERDVAGRFVEREAANVSGIVPAHRFGCPCTNKMLPV